MFGGRTIHGDKSLPKQCKTPRLLTANILCNFTVNNNIATLKLLYQQVPAMLLWPSVFVTMFELRYLIQSFD
jgi:hypothetical protein